MQMFRHRAYRTGVRRAHQRPPRNPLASVRGGNGRSCLNVALVLDIALDDLQGGAAYRGDEVGVGPQGRQPAAQVRKLLLELRRTTSSVSFQHYITRLKQPRRAVTRSTGSGRE